jgi:integrase
MVTGLVKRGRIFSARLFIPKDLRVEGGPTEVVKSLKTADRKQAVIHLRGIQADSERLFFMARIGMIDLGRINSMLLQYVEDQVTGRNVHPDFVLKVGKGEDQTAVAEKFKRDFYVDGKRLYVQQLARVLLDENSIDVPSEKDRISVEDTLAKVHGVALDELSRRAVGDYGTDYGSIVGRLLEESTPVTLKIAMDEWMQNCRRKGLSDGTMKLYRVDSATALEYFGDDYLVKKLSNKELGRFVDKQVELGLASSTVEKRYRLVQSVVEYASAQHGFPMPTYVISIKKKNTLCKPLTDSELNEMFTVISGKKKLEEWKYWSILVALLSGLRQDEICSLRVADVQQDDSGIWFIDFHPLKKRDDSLRRKVPVCAALQRLGFLEWVKRRAKTKDEFLFMVHLPGGKGYAQLTRTKLCDMFANMGHKFLVTDKKHEKVFHSMKHNFRNSLKQGGCRVDIESEISGHGKSKDEDEMRGVYTEVFGIEILAENIELAKWTCDFSRLRTYKP